MPMKYVMLKLEGGELLPVIFPEFFQHADIAHAVPAAVVSGGQVSLHDGKIIASGSSMSLGVRSRAADSAIMQAYFDGKNAIQREC